MPEPLHLVCVRTGDLYGPEYVERLFDMLLRNLSTTEREVRTWCVTDDPAGLPPGCAAIPADPVLHGYWQKVRLFAPDMPWPMGSRVAYFDLDVAVTGRLEDLVETKGIIQDWHWPCYNSSVMVWDHGEHVEAWERFDPALQDVDGPLGLGALLPKGVPNGGDQEWLTFVDQAMTTTHPAWPRQGTRWTPFPPEWCRSYRDAKVWPPAECKVVVFHGQPKPAALTEGWVPDVWKVGGFTSLPVMTGINVEREVIWSNIEANCKRDLPRFMGAAPSRGHSTAVICGGGPSLFDLHILHAIREHKRRRARLITLNNSFAHLAARGIVAHAHVMLDARRENIAFLEGMKTSGTQFFMASQCHPDVVDAAIAAAAPNSVTLWHSAIGAGERLEELEPEAIQVPGGGTVGTRAIWLAIMSGYRILHVYGMDGCYHGDQHHAYAQPLNDGEETMDVVMNGKHYRCARWMARQASEFEHTWKEARRYGVAVYVHGRGLIPDMSKALWEQERA